MSFFILSPILLIAGLVLLALFVGIIILLIKGGPAVRWFFGILLLLLVVGFVGLFSMHFVVSAPQAVAEWPAAATERPMAIAEGSPSPVQGQGAVVHIDKDPTVWAEGLEEELTPDIYSTLETAAYGLGVQLQETMDALPQLPTQVTILEDGIDNIALLEQFRRGLHYVLPETDILIASNLISETPPKRSIWITLKNQQDQSDEITIPEINNVDNIHMSQILNIANQRGSLQAILQTTDNKFSKQVEYDSRSWLQDVEAFRSHIGRGRWAVITSKEAVVTKEQADQQIRFVAMKYLANQIHIANKVGFAISDGDLRNYGLVVDEYSQRLMGLSGPIWRAAMLLDVSPERMQTLRQHKIVENQIHKKAWIFQLFSLIGMLVLICVLYLFVNAITKGYYSTTILIVSVIAFLVFLLLFFA